MENCGDIDQIALGFRLLFSSFFVAPLVSRPFVRPFVPPFVRESVNICVNSNFGPNVHVHFPRTIKATVVILGVRLHLWVAN